MKWRGNEGLGEQMGRQREENGIEDEEGALPGSLGQLSLPSLRGW